MHFGFVARKLGLIIITPMHASEVRMTRDDDDDDDNEAPKICSHRRVVVAAAFEERKYTHLMQH